jgi:hypothetical protein
LETGRLPLSPHLESGQIEKDRPELAQLLKGIIQANTLSSSGPPISNVILLRSLIGRAVFDWVLKDPFPVLGTECGPIWDELRSILDERGESELHAPKILLKAFCRSEFPHALL